MWIKPEIMVPYKIEDYLSNTDAALNAVYGYKPKFIEEVVLSNEIIEKIEGRYLFNEGQILTISKRKSGLSFEISDFIETSIRNVKSDLYPVTNNRFLTDISHASINYGNSEHSSIDSIDFIWDGKKKTIFRVPKNFSLPMELFNMGDIEKAIAMALQDKDLFRTGLIDYEFQFKLLFSLQISNNK